MCHSTIRVSVVLVNILLLLLVSGPVDVLSAVAMSRPTAAPATVVPLCYAIESNVKSNVVCSTLPYNRTTLSASAQLNSATVLFLQEKTPLSSCSHYLRLFLCSLYFPKCVSNFGIGTTIISAHLPSPSHSSSITACRSLCQHVRTQCVDAAWLALTQQFAILKTISCDQLSFSSSSSSSQCVDALDNYQLDKVSPNIISSNSRDRLFVHVAGPLNNNNSSSNRTGYLLPSLRGGACLPAEVLLPPLQDCSTKCSANMLYRKQDKRLVKIWFSIWALACATSTALTMITFVSDRGRFPYPERPVVYIAFCYFFYSLGVLLRLLLGERRVACFHFDKVHTEVLIAPGHETVSCMLVFILCHYFQTAGALWWLMLATAWYMSSARHWTLDDVDRFSAGGHVIAWGLPAGLILTVFFLHRIQADELTGLCVIANDNENSLLYFHIFPQLACLLIGALFITLGFASLWTIQRTLRKDHAAHNNAQRLEKLVAKVGLFAILYGLPSFCVFICLTYEFYHRNLWRWSLMKAFRMSDKCIHNTNGLMWRYDHCWKGTNSGPWPRVEVAMLKMCMVLTVGITSGMWVWANTKSMRLCLQFMRHYCERTWSWTQRLGVGGGGSGGGSGGIGVCRMTPTAHRRTLKKRRLQNSPSRQWLHSNCRREQGVKLDKKRDVIVTVPFGEDGVLLPPGTSSHVQPPSRPPHRL